MPNYKELKGKVAIITGAAQGIGRAIALRFASEGIHVVVADINLESAQSVADEIIRKNGKSLAIKVDVTQLNAINTMVSRTVETFNELNILVNNAGINAISRLVDTDEQTWDRVMAVNAKGVFLCSKVAALQMIKQQKGGRIINNASGSGKVVPGKNYPLGVYSASKHAVMAISKQLGHELADHQILVNCICAGIIDTPMWDQIDREMTTMQGEPKGSVIARTIQRIPLQRMAKPEEVANVVTFLASDEASYITADAINVAGGLLPY